MKTLMFTLFIFCSLFATGCNHKSEEVLIVIGTDNQKRAIHVEVDVAKDKVVNK